MTSATTIPTKKGSLFGYPRMWTRMTTTTLLAMAPLTAFCSISVTTVSLAVRSSMVEKSNGLGGWSGSECKQWKCTYIILGTLISNGQLTDRFTKAVAPVSHQPLVIFCHFYWRWNRQRRQVSKREFHLIWYFIIRVWGSVVDKANVSELFHSLRSRRLEVVGTRKNGRARRRHARGEEAPARKAPENRFPPPL